MTVRKSVFTQEIMICDNFYNYMITNRYFSSRANNLPSIYTLLKKVYLIFFFKLQCVFLWNYLKFYECIECLNFFLFQKKNNSFHTDFLEEYSTIYFKEHLNSHIFVCVLSICVKNCVIAEYIYISYLIAQ